MEPQAQKRTFFDRLLDGLAVLASLMIVFTMIAVSLDVFLRFFFNAPLLGITEITEYMMLYTCMLGAAWLLRSDGHVSIDIVTGLLPGKARKRLVVVAALVCAVTCAYITYWGAVTTWDHFERGIRDFKILEIPKWTFLVSIPIGFTLLTVEFLRKARDTLKKPDVKPGEEPTAF
jgi:TRAP-type C4-dicarboxylate transport system permease small subunit